MESWIRGIVPSERAYVRYTRQTDSDHSWIMLCVCCLLCILHDRYQNKASNLPSSPLAYALITVASKSGNHRPLPQSKSQRNPPNQGKTQNAAASPDDESPSHPSMQSQSNLTHPTQKTTPSNAITHPLSQKTAKRKTKK